MGIEKHKDVQKLISIGREKGYLNFDEVNELLPDDINSSEEIDDIFVLLGEHGIELIDSEDRLRNRARKDGKSGLEAATSGLEKTNDPVRMYLREMGIVSLLTKAGEVRIARRIERGELHAGTREVTG